jgi:mannosyltransferase
MYSELPLSLTDPLSDPPAPTALTDDFADPAHPAMHSPQDTEDDAVTLDGGPMDYVTRPYAPPSVIPAPTAETATPTGRESRWWLLLAPLVAGLTGWITSIDSGRQMWADEYATAYAARLSDHDFSLFLKHLDLVHGLYYMFIRWWTAEFGYTVFTFRLPSMIAMGVAAGTITILGRRLHSTAVGFAAGLVFAAIPTVSRYGEEARSYALVVALACLATLALVSVLEARSKYGWLLLRWLLYTVLILTLTYLHFAAAMVLLPHGILTIALWRRNRRWQLLCWPVTVLIVAAVVTPFLISASHQSGQVSWIRTDSSAVGRYPGELFGSVIMAWILAILAVAGATRLAQSRRNGRKTGLIAWALIAWAVVPPVFSYYTAHSVHLFMARYALFTLPAWALLAGCVFAAPPGARRVFPGTLLPGILATTIVLGFASLGGQMDMRADPVNGEPDFRSAAAVVEKGFQPGDAIVYASTYRFARIPFDYLLHRAKPIEIYAADTTQQTGTFYPKPCPQPLVCLGQTQRIWLVVTYSPNDFHGLTLAESKPLWKSRYDQVSTSDFTDVRVVLLVRRPVLKKPVNHGGLWGELTSLR